MTLDEEAGHVSAVRIITFQDLPQTSWRNGGGRTREIAAAPSARTSDALAWRVSVADVADSCDFSSFPGLDRVLVLCRGSNMVVTVDESEYLLQPFEMVAFPGEAESRATLVNGSTVDLNVMTRRGETATQVSVCVVDGTTPIRSRPSETVILVVIDGELRCRGGGAATVRLSPFDAIVLDHTNDQVELSGSGRIVRVELRQVH